MRSERKVGGFLVSTKPWPPRVQRVTYMPAELWLALRSGRRATLRAWPRNKHAASGAHSFRVYPGDLFASRAAVLFALGGTTTNVR